MKHAIEEDSKRKREESEEKPENGLSKNKMKKLAKQARNPKKLARLAKQDLLMCSECPNLPVNHTRIISICRYNSCIVYILQGTKCEYKLCRACCKKKCAAESVSCEGHTGMTGRRRELRNGENEFTEEAKIPETISNPVPV